MSYQKIELTAQERQAVNEAATTWAAEAAKRGLTEVSKSTLETKNITALRFEVGDILVFANNLCGYEKEVTLPDKSKVTSKVFPCTLKTMRGKMRNIDLPISMLHRTTADDFGGFYERLRNIAQSLGIAVQSLLDEPQTLADVQVFCSGQCVAVFAAIETDLPNFKDGKRDGTRKGVAYGFCRI